ncbi:GGDEF domain-containing protein [Sulfuricurvum sp.]|uniref:GGDEF domain-containing protein n=1 Tax=Sulfuricurvum sp. TaxID=2025608 RepID=UPI0026208516|nr:GGDEF domain-containing protein [Sulfuricurvum sp.]
MVETNLVNPLLIHFCRELTIQLDSLSNSQATINPTEFAELIATATHEVLDAYVSGEFDLQAYRSSTTEEYKELAQKSIDSYAATNMKIGEITERHAELLGETTASALIDFGKISEKFSAIQDHLSDEVTRANDVIYTLLEQVKTLEMKTSLDPLTKAFNRYALQEHLKAVLEKEKLDFESFALMIDVDNFKLINDRFGHIAGDKVLIFIAKLLKKALRDGDRVYRFGGEEFIILLNRTDSAGAQLVAERLLNLCRNNKPLFQNQQIPVTLSIGLTKIIEGDTMDAIITRSDVALYRAKKNGKDRLEMEF